MTGPQLATLSTIAWLVVTTILFIELANWSAGGSWTIVPGLVRGVRGWVVRGQEPELPAFALLPGAAVGAARPSAPAVLPPAPAVLSSATAASATAAPTEPTWYDLDPGAEIEELDHCEL